MRPITDSNEVENPPPPPGTRERRKGRVRLRGRTPVSQLGALIKTFCT